MMKTPSLWARLLSALTPWYDEDEADERETRTERVRQRSINVRIAAEKQLPSLEEGAARMDRLRAAYRLADQRLRRR